MRTFFIFSAAAILLAAVTVELSTRLWPGSSLALFIIAALVLIGQMLQEEDSKPALPEKAWASDEALSAPGLKK